MTHFSIPTAYHETHRPVSVLVRTGGARAAALHGAQPARARRHRPRLSVARATDLYDPGPTGRERRRGFHRGLAGRRPDPGELRRGDEIGRASCRERVEISVVAV